MKKTVTAETFVQEVLQMDAGIGVVFTRLGMHCPTCSAARGESLQQAAEVHEIDAQELIRAIEHYLSQK